MSVDEKIKQAAQLRPSKEKVLFNAVKRLKISRRKQHLLVEALSARPPWVGAREWKVIRELDAEALGPLYVDLPKDALAVLSAASIGATWASLSRAQRDAAQKMGKRFSRQRATFRKGRAPYPYTNLVAEYIRCIEGTCECRFRFSRAIRETDDATRDDVSGPPVGPMMEVLMAALDLALFASGSPKRETVASLVKQFRRLPALNPAYATSDLMSVPSRRVRKNA